MDKVREKFIKQDISLEEYTREAVLSTIDFLEEDYNYEFVQEIGRGSFGSVLELKNENKQSRLAVKVVIEEFVAEGEKLLWPNLSHENILPLINVEYIVSTYTYIFITPVHHSSLCNIVQSYDLVIDRNGIERAEYWLRGICRGINYLHQGGLCHLDLKISNVLISDNSTPIICDFVSLTRTVGPTKNYLSPLIYRPPECLDVKTTVNGFRYDIYTLGLLCLELFTKEALLTSKNVHNAIPSWSEILYPTIFDILEKNNFEILVKKTYMMSDVDRKKLCYVRDFIRACINVNSFKRPSSSDLLEHRLFKGDRDFKEIKNDIWIVRCNPDEVKFLLHFHAHRKFKSNVPLKAVETLVQPDENLEQDTVEKILVKVETDALAAELEKERLDSSCKSGEAEFVKLQPKKSEKRSFSEWINRKKRGLCNAISRLCCCHKKNTTVSST